MTGPSDRAPRDRMHGHIAERMGIDRRRFLAASGSAFAALALGCDSYGPRSAKGDPRRC